MASWKGLQASADQFLSEVVAKPEEFVAPTSELAHRAKIMTKDLFDFGKQTESVELGPLPQLEVEGFTADQIWEQMMLRNRPLLAHIDAQIARLLDDKRGLVFFPEDRRSNNKKKRRIEANALEKEDEEEEEDLASDDDEDEDDEAEMLDGSEDDSDGEAYTEAGFFDSDRTREGNDRFFDMDELSRFLDNGDEQEAERLRNERDQDDEDEDDDDEEEEEEEEEERDGDEDGEETQKKRKKRVLEDEGAEWEAIMKRATQAESGEDDEMSEGEEEEEEVDERDEGIDDDVNAALTAIRKGKERQKEEKEEIDTTGMSAHEKRMLRLKEKVKVLEEANVAEKPWMLRGEINAYNRPVGSLLEADLEFDTAYKADPVITPEFTLSLEDLIKKRVSEQSWDDVIRKADDSERTYKPNVELDFEKSAKSLADIYEQQFMEEAGKAALTDATNDKNKQEMQRRFRSICYRLDSLSSFYFVPRPPPVAPAERPNVPAIQMEEIIPVSTSDASLLAPEEVYEKKTLTETQSRDEMTREEKNTDRQSKKRKRNKARKERDADFAQKVRANPALKQHVTSSKDAALEKLSKQKNVIVTSKSAATGVTSSTSLFAQLNAERQDKQQKGDKKAGSAKAYREQIKSANRTNANPKARYFKI